MLALFYQIFTFANVTFMLKGLAMSVAIAVLATVISMFFGTILALIPFINVLAAAGSVVTVIVQLVGGILYLVFLYKASDSLQR